MVAITLNEYAKTIENDPITRAVVELFPASSDILGAIPWKTTNGPYQYSLEGSLPGIAFRGVNESYTGDYSIENPQVEQLFIAGGEADVDNFLLAMDSARRAREESRKIKSFARSITNQILAGDNVSTPKAWDGLQTRIKGSQIVANSNASGGGALSLAQLDDAIDRVQDPTHIIMSRAMRLKFKAAMRNQTLSGNLFMSKDEFGRDVMNYGGLPFLVGYEAGPDGRILPFTETGAGGGTAQCTSLYVVSFKEGNVCGIQHSPMSVKDLGELQSEPKHRTRVEWYTGMCIENPFAAARLSSITDAAIVA